MEVYRYPRYDLEQLVRLHNALAVVGACECGRWHTVDAGSSRKNPIKCKCGVMFYWTFHGVQAFRNEQ